MRLLHLACTALVILALAPRIATARSADLTVPTAQGPVIGKRMPKDAVAAWFGVPFAAPPVGPLRWAPPSPPATRNAPLTTTQYAAACYQPGYPTSSEDCLYLNIWRPDTEARHLPVIVWIHGGSNIYGNGNGSWYTVANLFNTIVVSINYRMGALGWFLHPALETGDKLTDSGDFGTLDQIAALAWVHANIANFGGDPDNITLAGESAGSQDVSYLMHSPLAKDYFAKAMIESNYPGIRPIAAALKSSAQVLDNLLVADGLAKNAEAAKRLAAHMSAAKIAAYLRGKSPHELYAAYKTPWFGAIDWGDFYRTDIDAGHTENAPPLIQDVKNRPEFVYAIGDGSVLPKIPFADFSKGNAFPKPLIVGNTRNENNAWNAYWPFNFQTGKSLQELLQQATFSTDPNYRIWRAFYALWGQQNVATFAANYTFAASLLDELDIYLASVLPARNLTSYTDPATNPVYVYRFDWAANPARDYRFAHQDAWRFYAGSIHGSELDFFWQTMMGVGGHAPPNGATYTNENLPGRQDLSRVVGAYLTAFINDPHGHIGPQPNAPDWQPWGKNNEQFMVLDADASHAEAGMTSSGIARDPHTLYALATSNPNPAVQDFIDYYVLWSWGWNWYPNASAGHFNTAPGPNRLFDPRHP